MIKVENLEVSGWKAAIRGMRNPMNSWNRSDSEFFGPDRIPFIGPDDHKLMMDLAKGGPVHAKYRRMISVTMDITAPLYWWKEMDTYMVGTAKNSCSTMHKIHAKEFELNDFSHEHLNAENLGTLEGICNILNDARKEYLEHRDPYAQKYAWWQMIQLLPSSYNQLRTWMGNYEVLARIYHDRKDHKLDEWRAFCEIIKDLPYSEIITGEDCEG